MLNKLKLTAILVAFILIPTFSFGAASFTKNNASGSTNGAGVKIAATSTPGTLFHTAVSGTTAGTWDEVWMWLFNSDTASHVCTVQFGGATAPDQNIVLTVPAQSGLIPVVPGLILDNGLTVKVFCDTTNVVTMNGFVNSMTTP